MARRQLRLPLLVAGVCALAALSGATFHANQRLLTLAGLRLQQAQEGPQQANVQVYAQYPPVPATIHSSLPAQQRYLYINGQPYALLGESLQYLPAQEASAPAPAPAPYTAPAPAPYTAPPADLPAAPAGATAANAEGPGGAETQGQLHASAEAPAAPTVDVRVTDSTNSVVPEGAAAEAGSSAASAPVAPEAPAAPVDPTSYAAGAAPGAPAVDSAAGPAGPALVAGPTVYLSSSSSPGLTAEGPVTLSVGNPKVTVHRTVTQYTSQEPPQVVPRDVVITFTRNGQAAPIRIPLRPVNTFTAPFKAEYNTEPTLVKTTSSWTVPTATQPGDKPGAGAALQPTATFYSQPGSANPTSAPLAPSRPTVSITTYSQPGSPGAPFNAAPTLPPAASQPSVSITTYSQPQPGAAVTLVPALPPAANRPSVSITTYSQPGASYSQQGGAAAGGPSPDSAGQAQVRNLQKVFEDPTTQKAYYTDNTGRIFDAWGHALPMAPGAPTASANEAPASSGQPATYWGGLKGLGSEAETLPVGSGPTSGSTGSSSSTGSVSEDYKQDDMTGLLRMYAPTTYQPVPPPANYDQPLTLSISTGKSAQNNPGPASPLSPGEQGPSRGDSW